MKLLVEANPDKTIDIFVEEEFVETETAKRAPTRESYLEDTIRTLRHCLQRSKHQCEWMNVRAHYADLRTISGFSPDFRYAAVIWSDWIRGHSKVTSDIGRWRVGNLPTLTRLLLRALVHESRIRGEPQPHWPDALGRSLAFRPQARARVEKQLTYIVDAPVSPDKVLPAETIREAIRRSSDFERRQKLSKYSHEEVARALLRVYTQTQGVETFKISGRDLYILVTAIGAIASELDSLLEQYTLARMFRTYPKPKAGRRPILTAAENIAGYFGDAHIQNMLPVLMSLGMTLTASATSKLSGTNDQCIDMSAFKRPFFASTNPKLL